MILRQIHHAVTRPIGISNVCLRFLREVTKSTNQPIARNFSRSSRCSKTTLATPQVRSEYFCHNEYLQRARLVRTNTEQAHAPVTENIPLNRTPSQTLDLPHRRRQREQRDRHSDASGFTLPNNTSSTVTNRASTLPANSPRRLISTLLSLSKPRLSILVVLTAMASYSLYPVPELLQPSLTNTPSLSTLTLLFLTTGTALCAASANTFNMLYEPQWDALMSRTRNRPLVRGLISKRGALIYGIMSGLVGVGALYYGVNSTVAILGGMNILLYAAVYTPMKRITVLNTWVGALVGGIPPLMGWAAAAGQSATSGNWQELLLGEQNIGAWLLASLLVAWQLAHFMSLSFSIREEYKNAGYRMLCWTNPARNARVALRYSLAVFPICVGLCWAGVTEWTFAIASTSVNLWLVKEAGRFWYHEGCKSSARGLFWASVWHLPVVLVLAMVQKKAMWSRILRTLGWFDEEDEEDWDEEIHVRNMPDDRGLRQAVVSSR